MVAAISPLMYLFAAGVLLASLGLAGLLWLVLGAGPRRGRAYRRAQRLLHAGAWKQALAIVRTLRNARLRSALWQGRLRNLEGECLKQAGDVALQERRYEQALEQSLASAELLGLDGKEIRNFIVDRVLSDARQHFAQSQESADQQAEDLLSRLILVQPDCAEAYFWLGMCQARGGAVDLALASFEKSAALGNKRFVDPPLYQGALLLSQGRAQEALRCLGEANRVDSSCPLVTWQLGMALVSANGDCNLAVRALNRALGERGLVQWLSNSSRAWVEAFPEGSSYVRRLASKHRFSCPVFGSDFAAMIRQGQLTLAQAQGRLGNFQESAELYRKILGEVPPTPALLQGLGISLARLDRYDEAFKHLRAALEQEEPKTHQTGGYLALCGALGKPSRPEDKARNVQWAIRLLARFDVLGDLDWARINNLVFAEARQLHLPLELADQARLAQVLVSVSAFDALSAQALAHLAATHPDSVQREHACLYCHAAQQHGVTLPQDLQMFGLLFRNEPAARTFFAERQWSLEEAVFTYLERCAAQRPGHFPVELGPNFPPTGEKLLLDRSQNQLTSGQKEAALATAEVLAKLAPQSSAAHDWLAQVHYRLGQLAAAAEELRRVQQLRPDDYVPVLREAIVQQQLDNRQAVRHAIRRALAMTIEKARSATALLGARLVLKGVADDAQEAARGLQEAGRLLEECLRAEPGNLEALWQLAAVRLLQGDGAGVAELAPALTRPDARDPRIHFLAAVSHLAAGDPIQAQAAAERAATEPALASECHYLQGLAALHRNERPAAVTALEKAAANGSSSANHARALLGSLLFENSQFEDAVKRWQGVEKPKQSIWRIEEPLRSTVYLTALKAFAERHYELAAERFHEAGKLGLRERNLGALIGLSLVRAGQRLLFDNGE
jgi:tetratricopeptide (TPR) repeat protein